MFGGSRFIGPEETVSGDLVVFGGRAEVQGILQGDLVSLGGETVVQGQITGDLISVGGSINLLEGSRISGNIVRVGGTLSGERQVHLGGEFRTFNITGPFRLGFPFFHVPPAISAWGSVFTFFYRLLFTLLITFLFAANVRGTAATMKEEWGLSILIGFLAFILLLPVVIFFLITILGIPLALLILVGYYLAVLLGQVSLYYLLGQWLMEKMGRSEQKIMGTAVLGLLGIFLLQLIIRVIPFIGGPFHLVIMALIYMVALGASLKSRFGTNRPWVARD